MGLTSLDLEIANPARPERRRKVRLLVDSGAVYSVIDRKLLEKLRIEPSGERSFDVPNADSIQRQVGSALFYYEGRQGPATVVFGEEGDSPLLGWHTLGALRLTLDPFKRELRPMRMLLGRVS